MKIIHALADWDLKYFYPTKETAKMVAADFTMLMIDVKIMERRLTMSQNDLILQT